MGQQRKYNALRNVPWQVRADIQKQIEQMEDGNEKTILTLYFLEDMSPRQIITHCQENGIYSRNRTFYTTRSIQNIVKKHFPEVAQYRKPNPQKELRREHHKFVREYKKVACGRCGSPEVVLHHMVPASNGRGEKLGDSTLANMVCLCPECHKETNEYYRQFDWSTLKRRKAI